MKSPKRLWSLTGALALGVALVALPPAGRAIAHPHDDDEDQDIRVRVLDEEGGDDSDAKVWIERDGDGKRIIHFKKDDGTDGVIELRDVDRRRVIDLENELSDVRGGYLGVMVQDVTRSLRRAMDLSTDQGALINRVEEDSPADEAGLKKGDVIVEVNHTTIDDAGDLTRLIRRTDPGKDVTVVVIRDGNRKTLKATLAKRPKSMTFMSPGIPGMRLRDLEDLNIDVPKMRERFERMLEHRGEMEDRLERLERQLERLSEQLERLNESLREEGFRGRGQSRRDREPVGD